MSTKRGTGLAIGAATLIAIASVTSCAALEDYSGRVGRSACRAAGTCTVYDGRSTHQEPCWPTEDGPMAYPGDPGWPFEHGVCDTVAEMNAPWPEGSDSAHPISTTTVATHDTTARQ